MTEIVVDAFGGDYSPEEIILGSLNALKLNKDLGIVLTGDENKINEFLSGYEYDSNRIRVVHAPEIISNNESPTAAIRTKRESSIVKAFDELRTNENVVGLVSAGSTGAVLTGAFLKLGRIKGVSRPATCPILPTKNGGKVALMDSGANVDCKPINLVHFAIMANAYMKEVYKIENPRIGLLSVGTEDHKGNELTTQVFQQLKNMPEINFVGNMEARDLLSGNYDVVICDGFNGNVLLKSTEGAIKFVLSNIKQSIKQRFLSKVGALFMKKTFSDLKKKLDYSKHGGAVMLGCKKVVVKCHGDSKSESICNAIMQVVDAHNANLCGIIDATISKYGDLNE